MSGPTSTVDPKARFTDRVDDYARFRPEYPRGLLELFVDRCALGPGKLAADVGSGTGILTRLLLQSGARVAAVEPNAAMRAAAEAELSTEDRFESVDGSAEETGLPAACVDLIAAGQSFHWFEPARCRLEFGRILEPHGWVALVWNRRSDTPLGRDYEDLLERFAPDYAHVRTRERAAESSIHAFFAPQAPNLVKLHNEQTLDEEGLRGRLLSSSYAPRAGHPLHAPMMHRLGEVFRAHAQRGTVTLAYDTVVWYGQLVT